MEKGFNKTLTIVLIVLISAIIAVLTIIVVKSFKAKRLMDEGASAADNFTRSTPTIISGDGSTGTGTNSSSSLIDLNSLPTSNETSNSTTTSSASKVSKNLYHGFTVLGTIRIPKTKLKLPILATTTKDAMEQSVCFMWGVGLNKVGNTVITGHNYRNNTFFSNNKKLENGDSIFITDESNTEIEYKIYDILVLPPDEFEYAERDTQGKREINLSTCTDDVANRLVIFAREKE